MCVYECVCVCVCVCVPLANQDAKSMLCIILSPVACTGLQYFNKMSYKEGFYRKNGTDHDGRLAQSKHVAFLITTIKRCV